MADIKFLKFVATIAGTKEILIQDVPEGISFDRNHIRPISARRTQNGDLISQTIGYNKKNFTISGGQYDFTLIDYFKTIYENNETITFTIYDYVNYVLTEEVVYSMKMVSFEDSKDFSGTTREWSITLAEI